jgi:2'-5' RNA ligase
LIDEKMAALGIAKEGRVFSPHLTLARGAGRSGAPRRNQTDGLNNTFQRLRERLSALPAPGFGTMSAREFYLYQSHLSPKGSTYTKLAAFHLQESDHGR